MSIEIDLDYYAVQAKRGCSLHNSCFTCPFPDCVKSDDSKSEGMKRYYENNREQILARLRAKRKIAKVMS